MTHHNPLEIPSLIRDRKERTDSLRELTERHHWDWLEMHERDREEEMDSTELWQNSDGTWTARIYDTTRTFRTREEAETWILYG